MLSVSVSTCPQRRGVGVRRRRASLIKKRGIRE
jgi:hypothetical protein